MKNRLINPTGQIWQRAVAAANDLAYFVDRFQLLTQTNTVTPSALTDPENGYATGVRITQSQASAQRFGFMQKIESINCRDLRGNSVALWPRIRCSSSQAIRYAILEWIGTADSITNDPVNDWTSSTYTGGNFFVASNFNVLAVGSQTPSANTWTSLAAITASAGSSMNNLIVAVWTEGTAAQNVTLDFDYIQLEKGSAASGVDFRMDEIERRLCERYLLKFTAVSGNDALGGMGVIYNGGGGASFSWHGTRMRTTSTMSYSGTLQVGNFAGGLVNASAITPQSTGANSHPQYSITAAGAGSGGGGAYALGSAGVYIQFDAEL